MNPKGTVPKGLNDCPKDTFYNKLWRLQNLYKIVDKNKNVVNMVLNSVQKDMVRDIYSMDPIRYFVLKFRQGGVSTFWLLWWLDECLVDPNVYTGILAHKRESLEYLFQIIKFAYDNVPEYIDKPKLLEENKTNLAFDNGSRIFVSLEIRSKGVHNLHISEWCFIKDENVRATLGACSPMTNITGETTGNGVGNDGYQTYQDAKLGLNGFKHRFFAWNIQDEYRVPLNGMTLKRNLEESKLPFTDEQILFRRMKKKELKDLFPQEYPENDQEAFIASGLGYFNPRKIMRLIEGLKVYTPIEQTEDYVMFERPKTSENKNDVFIAGADTAEGVDGDFSTLTIYNASKRRQAFRFKGHYGVDTFYKICDRYCRMYNNALLGVERNNHGHAVILGLNEMCHYPNLYKQNKDTQIIGSEFREPRIGFDTTNITKPLMLDFLKECIEGDSLEDENTFTPQFKIYDVEFLKECLTLENRDGKLGAAQGKHDDLIISNAIALQMFLEVKGKIRQGNAQMIIGEKRELT